MIPPSHMCSTQLNMTEAAANTERSSLPLAAWAVAGLLACC